MESELARAHVIVRGLVQGVFYRAGTVRAAASEGLCGWVMNRPDGGVEAVFEGEREAVRRVVEWCREGPPLASVEDVSVTWEEYRGEFTDFSIRYSPEGP